MKKKLGKKEVAGKLSRREFLKAGAAGLGVAALGTLPTKVLGAPATIKGTKLSILQGTYFIAPGQDLYKKQAQEWGQANGVSVSADFLNWPDLQPKIAASVQAGGYDIVELWPGWNYLYSKNLVDLNDMAEEFGKRDGGFEKYVLNSGKVGGRWLGIPHGYSNASMAYRIELFKEAGCPNAEDGNKVDLTWEEYFAIAKKLKAKGKPFGQALGHSTGDPPGFCYPYMWSYGAMEVSKDGKSIQFNKPEFVDGMQKFIQAWKDGYDETGTSWDDSNNNRAYLSEQISSTFNGSSIYFAAKKDKPDLAERHPSHPDSQGPVRPVLLAGDPDLRHPEELQERRRRQGVPEVVVPGQAVRRLVAASGRVHAPARGEILQRPGLVQGPQDVSLPGTAEVRDQPGLCRTAEPEGGARLVEVHRRGHFRQGGAVRRRQGLD